MQVDKRPNRNDILQDLHDIECNQQEVFLRIARKLCSSRCTETTIPVSASTTDYATADLDLAMLWHSLLLLEMVVHGRRGRLCDHLLRQHSDIEEAGRATERRHAMSRWMSQSSHRKLE